MGASKTSWATGRLGLKGGQFGNWRATSTLLGLFSDFLFEDGLPIALFLLPPMMSSQSREGESQRRQNAVEHENPQALANPGSIQ
jgi:hypothetical protein